MGIGTLGKIPRTHVSAKLMYAYYNYKLNYICCLDKEEFLRGEDHDERKELRKLCSKCRRASLSREKFPRLYYGENCGGQVRIAAQYPGAERATFVYLSKIKLNLTSSSYSPKLGKSFISGSEGLPVLSPRLSWAPKSGGYPDG